MNPLRFFSLFVLGIAALAVPGGDAQPPVPFETERGWGYRDAGGTTVLEPRWAWAEPFAEGVARVASAPGEGESLRWAYIDTEGRELIGGLAAAGPMTRGRALVRGGGPGEFFFISRSGERVGPLISAVRADLTPPSEPFGKLADYAAGVAGSQEYELLANPAKGERRLILQVRALNGGAVAVREAGWEGEDFVLLLPGHTVETVKALADAIFGARLASALPSDAFSGEPAWELPEPEFAAEFVRIRVRPDGVVELVHTIWYS